MYINVDFVKSYTTIYYYDVCYIHIHRIIIITPID